MVSKREFLLRVMRHPSVGKDLDAVMVYDVYVRENVRIAAQALQLRLVRLAKDPGGLGYQVRITPAGVHAVHDRLEEAAAEIDRGTMPCRIYGPEPGGPIGARLLDDCRAIPLSSSLARTHAAEVLRGIATGHLRVEGEYLVRSDPRKTSAASLEGGSIGGSSLGQRNLAHTSRVAR